MNPQEASIVRPPKDGARRPSRGRTKFETKGPANVNGAFRLSLSLLPRSSFILSRGTGSFTVVKDGKYWEITEGSDKAY